MALYLATLAVVASYSLLREGSRRVACLLIAGQVYVMASVAMTGRYDLWQAYAAFDLFAAWATLREPTNRLSAMMGATFLMSLVADVAFGIASSQSWIVESVFGRAPFVVSLSAYLGTMQFIAWLQLGVMGLWHGAGGVRRVVYRLLPRRGAAVDSGRHKGVATWGG